MPAGFLAAAAFVGAGASIYAADSQRSAQHQSMDLLGQTQNRIARQEAPYMQVGGQAAGRLSDLFAPGADLQAQLEKYPGYQFALKAGGQAIRNADTPGMGALSGAALKDLMNFNQQTASGFYNNYFSQLYNTAAMGQNAAAGLGTNTTNLGTGMAQANAAAGASQAAGIYGAGNSMAGNLMLAGMMQSGSGMSLADQAYMDSMQPGYVGP